MSSYNEELIRIARKYMSATKKTAYTAREVAVWAIQNHLWGLRDEKLISLCVEEFARAFKEERFTDPQGRRVRHRHVVKIDKDGEQIALWEDFNNISEDHFQLSLMQRRKQIVGECVQLDIDKDSFNENRKPSKQIELSFDFTADVAEDKIMRTVQKRCVDESLQPSSRLPLVKQQPASRPVLSRN